MADFSKARGVAAMDRAKSGARGGAYWNYIRWSEDKETKYVQFLTPASELITLQLHEWIEVGKTKNGKPRYGFFIDRRDPCIGEDYDDLTDRLETPSKRRTLGAAVELEPKFTRVNNRNKVTGFEVKLETYTRTTEDGDSEEVEAPILGIVSQAKGNFYGFLGSYAESHEPIEDVPFEIQRTGKGTETQYMIVPFTNIEVDYSNLIAHLGNVGSIPPDVREELAASVSSDGKVDAMAIGAKYLDLHLEDLADPERYAELVGPIDYIEDKWGNRAKTRSAPEPVADEPVASNDVEEEKITQLRRQFSKK